MIAGPESQEERRKATRRNTPPPIFSHFDTLRITSRKYLQTFPAHIRKPSKHDQRMMENIPSLREGSMPKKTIVILRLLFKS